MVVRGLTALLTLAVLAVGLPVLLYRLGGSPIPAHVPSWHRITYALLHKDNGSLFLGAVRDVSWLAWVAFAIAVLAETQAALRGRQAPRLRLAGLQGVASRLVAAVALTFSAPAVLGLVAAPAMAATAHPATPQAPRGPAMDFAHQLKGATTEATVVVVRPGDCLWTIAQRYLGSGERFTAIIRLNLGHPMGGGEVFTDPSVIRAGWQLRLPTATGRQGTVATSRASADRAADHGQGADRSQTGPHDSAGSHDGHPSADPRFHRPHRSAGHGATEPVATPGSTGSGTPAPPRQGADTVATTTGQHQQLPEVALFTLGMLAGGALASLERLRHRQRQYRRSGRRIALPQDEESRRIETKLRAAARAGLARWTGADDLDDADDSVDASPIGVTALPATLADALRDLSEAVAAGGDPLPPIIGIHLTATALDVLLSAPAVSPPPPPFTITPARQAMSWTVDLDGPAGPRPTPLTPGEVGDLLPGLFTAGVTDSGGYLLLDLEAMRVTCCDGPDDLTDRMLVTAATELASSRWSGWYDLILVGCDELDILGRAELCGDLEDALDLLDARARTVDSRLRDGGPPDVRSRRLADPEDEDWGLALLVSRHQPTPDQMTRLLELADGPGGIAALVAGDTQADDGKVAPGLFQLEADPDRPDEIVASVSIADLGHEHRITVWPQTLTIAEYEALAGIFATAADLADVDSGADPYDDTAGPPWIRLAAAPVAPTDEDEPRAAADYAAPDNAVPNRAAPDYPGAERQAPHRSGPVGYPGHAQEQRADPWGAQLGAWADHRAGADAGQRGTGPAGYGRADSTASWGAESADRRAGDHDNRVVPGPWPNSPLAHGRDDQSGRVADKPAGPWRHPGSTGPQSPSVLGSSAPGSSARGSSVSGSSVLGIDIKVLGPVEIVGAAEPLQPKQAELVLALALHAPVGLSNSALCTLLGADDDHPRPTDSVRQLITRTRRRLGQAPDGQEYIVHLGSGIYVLHADARLDWTAFSALATRGRAAASAADLHAALAMVRGQPLADCYHWWIDISLIETIRAEIVDTAELLANLELTAGDPQAAARAARAGLAAEAASEQLWRALMCAEHDSGNLDGVTAAWNGCLDAISEIAPGADPHPDTERLYRQLTRAAAVPAGLRY